MNPTPPPSAPSDKPLPPAQQRQPAPGPVNTAHESVAGEEDPGAGVEGEQDSAFNHLPPGLDHPG